MVQTHVISPSILSSDLLNLANELKNLEEAKANWIHVDVMDGHFVPNLTFGLPLVSALKKGTHLPLDVHLMISNPDAFVLDYIKAGADIVTIHWEATTNHHRLIDSIKQNGKKAGISINPGTPISSLGEVLHYVDLILLMSVNPGFSGQKYLPHTKEKLLQLTKILENNGRLQDVMIQVDGGINDQNILQLAENGATSFVVGSYLFQEHSSISQQMQKLQKVLKQMSQKNWVTRSPHV